jgi:hypothetical protein
MNSVSALSHLPIATVGFRSGDSEYDAEPTEPNSSRGRSPNETASRKMAPLISASNPFRMSSKILRKRKSPKVSGPRSLEENLPKANKCPRQVWRNWKAVTDSGLETMEARRRKGRRGEN